MSLPYFPYYNAEAYKWAFDGGYEHLTDAEFNSITPVIAKAIQDNWDAFEPVGIVIDAHPVLQEPLVRACHGIVISEAMFNFIEPGKPYDEYSHFRLYLREHVLKNQHYLEHKRDIIWCLEQRFAALASVLTEAAQLTDDDGLFQVELWQLLADPLAAMDYVLGLFLTKNVGSSGALSELWRMLWTNATKLGRMSYEKAEYVKPSKSGLTPQKAMERYFYGTSLYPLFEMDVKIAFPRKLRYEHMHILGAQGAGKTTMLENLIARDIEAPDKPSVVVIEPHSDLTKKLLARHIAHAERIIHIDPRDTEYPPALNLFHISEERIAKYGEKAREQQATAIVDTFDFLFTNLLDTKLTGKQSFFLRYIARLLVTLPQTMDRTATLIDVMRLMENRDAYQEAIDRLPELQREFFEVDFKSGEYKETKDQIRYRIRAIIENPTLERLFSCESNAIDLFEALNSGKIILIDTAKDFLKSGSSAYGRIFLSLILQAILERAAVPEGQRRPTFVYIDEAADLIDRNIDSFITEARKYNAGLILAHQRLEQAGPEFRAALAGTALKLAGGLSSADAYSMAADMRTDKQWLLNLKKYRFGYFARGQLERAVDVGVPPPPEPDWDHYNIVYPHFREFNRRAITGLRQPSPPPPEPMKKGDDGRGVVTDY